MLHAAGRHSGTLRRLVYVSSAGVYGIGAGSSNVGARFSEADPLTPGSVCANTELWGEDQTALALGHADSYTDGGGRPRSTATCSPSRSDAAPRRAAKESVTANGGHLDVVRSTLCRTLAAYDEAAATGTPGGNRR